MIWFTIKEILKITKQCIVSVQCIKLGLDVCPACNSNYDKCWVECYREEIELGGKLYAIETYKFLNNGSNSIRCKYFNAAIKHYYPEHLKLFVLI